MTDNTAPTASYVDTYSPPAASTAAPTPVAPVPSVAPSTPTPVVTEAPTAPMYTPPAVVTPPVTPAAMPAVTSPSTPEPAETPEPAATSQSPITQALEDQNIFFLLGVTEAKDEEKESFLDELQQVIWEDFLENDVELLITQEEMTELKTIMGQKPSNDLEQQEAIVTYLEKLIPDLEEIMLEKALELKADMVKERVEAMKEYYTAQPEVLEKLHKATTLMTDDQWREAAEVLNSIT
jgi:hypothetical protein